MGMNKGALGENSPCFIIAELSANHGQNIQVALDTIQAAKDAGADAIKLQTYKAETITLDSDKDWFKVKHGTVWDGVTLFDLYKEAYTPWEWHEELFVKAEELGLVCFSSPFDFSAVDFLETLNPPFYKVASFEITDIPLIKKVAETGKPIIISTGIAELEDIELALETCRRVGNNQITLLKCTSSYPAPLEEINLKTMTDFKAKFGVNYGLSDHTIGADVAVASVALGANVVEKHFILDKSIGGPDASFSMEPKEFKYMVDSIRNVEKALGKVSYELSEKSKVNREFSRSLFVVDDVKKGDLISHNNIRSIRPGYGMHPKELNNMVGRSFSQDIERGTPLSFDLIEK